MLPVDPVKKSRELQKQAEEVIRKTKIVSALENLGVVHFVGSYVLELLCRPDIDIFVIGERCESKKALNTTLCFLENNVFQTVGFADCLNYKCSNSPKGFYWELVYFYNDNRWKLDIWYTPEKKIKAIQDTAKIMKKLKQNPGARKDILELKYKLYDGEKYKQGMNGFKIYEKILGKI